MDRYSMEELIQLGQGRAGLGRGLQRCRREGWRPPAGAGLGSPSQRVSRALETPNLGMQGRAGLSLRDARGRV